MSVINQMLQDLDRRNAMTEGERLAQPVKPADRGRQGHEWFWRTVAALLLAAVAWVGWVAYQLQPRPLVTEQALRAAAQARAGTLVAAAPQPPKVEAPQPVEAPPAAEPQAVQAKAMEPAPPPPPPEMLKLARAIETPIVERPAAPVPVAAAPAKRPEPRPSAPKAAAAPPPAPKAKGTVDKRERATSAADTAEARFRRAAGLLNQGRISEAEALLRQALSADASHVAARQAYVALLLEQGRVREASEALAEALAAHPGSQPAFALALARIHVDRGNYEAALDVLERAGGAAASAELEAMRGLVLQRQERHAEAVSAFRGALQGPTQAPTSWMGLAISLEALGHRAEAAEAYRRALAGGPLAGEVRQYAEARIKALE